MMPAGVAQVRREVCQREGCLHKLDYSDPCAECPDGHWGKYSRDCEPQTKGVGLGDLIEKIAKPIARALKLPCYDDKGNLKPESGCGKRKAIANKFRL